MVSHNRSDSLLYANLLSSALNELLETAFIHHGPDGDFSCRVSRAGAMGLSWTMDKVGPICRTAEDCVLVLNAIRGSDGRT